MWHALLTPTAHRACTVGAGIKGIRFQVPLLDAVQADEKRSYTVHPGGPQDGATGGWVEGGQVEAVAAQDFCVAFGLGGGQETYWLRN